MKIGLGAGAAALVGVLFVMSGLAGAATAAASSGHPNASPSLGKDASGCYDPLTIYMISTFPTTDAYETASWDCSATDQVSPTVPLHAWGDDVWGINNIGAGPLTVYISVSDEFYVGDWYTVFETSNVELTSGWAPIGHSQAVVTGPQLFAPGYNPRWTGTGTEYSCIDETGCPTPPLYVTIPAGTAYFFDVVDTFEYQVTQALDGPCGTTPLELLTYGCSASAITVAPGWSPAGLVLDFYIPLGPEPAGSLPG